jgi:hypothetical protein
MPVSTIDSSGLTSPLSATNLGTPSAINLSNATALAKAALPTGSVLQVVNTNYTTNVTTTSTSLIATGLTANITPSSTSSKVLIFCSMAGVGITSSNNGVHFEIYRNGSSVSYFDDIFGFGTANINATTSISWQDSPSSTSALTYTIYWKRSGSGTGTAYINNYVTAANQTLSTLTLMEIAG